MAVAAVELAEVLAWLAEAGEMAGEGGIMAEEAMLAAEGGEALAEGGEAAMLAEEEGELIGEEIEYEVAMDDAERQASGFNELEVGNQSRIRQLSNRILSQENVRKVIDKLPEVAKAKALNEIRKRFEEAMTKAAKKGEEDYNAGKLKKKWNPPTLTPWKPIIMPPPKRPEAATGEGDAPFPQDTPQPNIPFPSFGPRIPESEKKHAPTSVVPTETHDPYPGMHSTKPVKITKAEPKPAPSWTGDIGKIAQMGVVTRSGTDTGKTGKSGLTPLEEYLVEKTVGAAKWAGKTAWGGAKELAKGAGKAVMEEGGKAIQRKIANKFNPEEKKQDAAVATPDVEVNDPTDQLDIDQKTSVGMSPHTIKDANLQESNENLKKAIELLQKGTPGNLPPSSGLERGLRYGKYGKGKAKGSYLTYLQEHQLALTAERLTRSVKPKTSRPAERPRTFPAKKTKYKRPIPPSMPSTRKTPTRRRKYKEIGSTRKQLFIPEETDYPPEEAKQKTKTKKRQFETTETQFDPTKFRKKKVKIKKEREELEEEEPEETLFQSSSSAAAPTIDEEKSKGFLQRLQESIGSLSRHHEEKQEQNKTNIMSDAANPGDPKRPPSGVVTDYSDNEDSSNQIYEYVSDSVSDASETLRAINIPNNVALLVAKSIGKLLEFIRSVKGPVEKFIHPNLPDGTPFYGGFPIGLVSIEMMNYLFDMNMFELVLKAQPRQSSKGSMDLALKFLKSSANSFPILTNLSKSGFHTLRYIIQKTSAQVKMFHMTRSRVKNLTDNWLHPLISYNDVQIPIAVVGAAITVLSAGNPPSGSFDIETIIRNISAKSLVVMSDVYVNLLIAGEMSRIAFLLMTQGHESIRRLFCEIWDTVFAKGYYDRLHNIMIDMSISIRSGSDITDSMGNYMKLSGLVDQVKNATSLQELGMDGIPPTSIEGTSLQNSPGKSNAIVSTTSPGKIPDTEPDSSTGNPPGTKVHDGEPELNLAVPVKLPQSVLNGSNKTGKPDDSVPKVLEAVPQEAVSFSSSELLNQQQLLSDLNICLQNALDYFGSGDFQTFLSVMESNSSLSLDRPEEESKLHLDPGKADKDTGAAPGETPETIINGVPEEIENLTDLIFISANHLMVMVESSISFSDGVLTRSNERDRQSRISAERSERINRRHVREVMGSSKLRKGARKAFVTGDITCARDIAPAIVGELFRLVLRIQKTNIGQTTGSNSKTSNAGLFITSEVQEDAMRLADITAKERDDRHRMQAIQSTWDDIIEYLTGLINAFKKLIHAAHVSGAGQLLQTQLVVQLVAIVAQVNKATSFASYGMMENLEDPERNNSFIGGGGFGPNFKSLTHVSPNNITEEQLSKSISEITGQPSDDAGEIGERQTQDSLQLRPTFLQVGGNAIRKSREDLILNELLWNAFDYVGPNGYLGERNKIYRDHVRNQQLRFKAPLFVGKKWEPNHGLHPLRMELQTNQGESYLKGKIDRMKRKLQNQKYSSSSRKLRALEILPGDLNQMPSQIGLPYRKPTPFRFTIDNQFQMQPDKPPAGFLQSRQKLRNSKLETWNSPFQGSKTESHRRPLKEKMAEYFNHLSSVSF